MDQHWPEVSILKIEALDPDPKKCEAKLSYWCLRLVTTLNYSDWLRDL